MSRGRIFWKYDKGEKAMGSFTFQTIVLVLIGAVVFALGTINIRGHFRMKSTQCKAVGTKR